MNSFIALSLLAVVGVAIAAPAKYGHGGGHQAAVHPGPSVVHTYPAVAPAVKCGHNLLVSCATHHAAVPCKAGGHGHGYGHEQGHGYGHEQAHGGYGHQAPAPAYHHDAPAPAYHHAPAPAYHHAPEPSYHHEAEHGEYRVKKHGKKHHKKHGKSADNVGIEQSSSAEM